MQPIHLKSLVRFASAFFAVALIAGCATQVDRHGRPIDKLSKITVDTSPDPGAPPTRDELLAALQRDFGKKDTSFALRSSRDAAWSHVGTVMSGWLVCYDATGPNVFGQIKTNRTGATYIREKSGELKWFFQLQDSSIRQCQ
ncbi:hypothetical protein ACNI65_11665 [Roseateles sp. So40a]|uniref:hypothetical protein n=1 Tax=Roseateles sp. So40a TaxID=3400226 RepID=UPI003A85B686